MLGGKPFCRQAYCEEVFTPLPAGTPLLPLSPGINSSIDPRSKRHELFQLQFTDYHPEFWQTYQRPTAGK